MTWMAAWDAKTIQEGTWDETTNADGQRVIRVRWDQAEIREAQQVGNAGQADRTRDTGRAGGRGAGQAETGDSE